MRAATPQLGLGIGWRPELALWIDRRPDLGFVEIVAENFDPAEPIPKPLELLRERGVAVIPHGISLSLGSAEPLDRRRLDHLARLAERLDSPLVSEHAAFVRAGGIEAGHLLPVPRTAAALDVLVENIAAAQQVLPVPLAIENITALVEWPESEFDEPAFLRELLERSGAGLLLDISNVFANCANHSRSAAAYLDELPLERIAYVHVGGGMFEGNAYHDTHAHAVVPEVVELIEQLAARTSLPGIMLERDDRFPAGDELTREFAALVAAQSRGDQQRRLSHVA
jgi:hypothetical protein